jgi:hypothetical protein
MGHGERVGLTKEGEVGGVGTTGTNWSKTVFTLEKGSRPCNVGS